MKKKYTVMNMQITTHRNVRLLCTFREHTVGNGEILSISGKNRREEFAERAWISGKLLVITEFKFRH